MQSSQEKAKLLTTRVDALDLNYPQWRELSVIYMEVVVWAGGPQKSSDGDMYVKYTNGGIYEIPPQSDWIFVSFGAYSIADWRRDTTIGPFTSERNAWLAAVNKVKEAIGEVLKDLNEEFP